jgi:transposase
MDKHYRPYEPDQPLLLPAALTDYLPAEDLAYFIPEVVAELDLAAILASYEREGRGYPPYHPQMMVGLILYAYARGVYSSRRMAFGCTHDVGFMVVTARQTPDFRTIASFRKRHLATLADLFGQVPGLAQRAGLLAVGHVALDGTKVRANASRQKAMSYGRMLSREQAYDAEIRRWFEEAERQDAAEDARYGAEQDGYSLPPELATREKRLAAIRKAKAELEAEAKRKAEERGADPAQTTVPERAQYNFTDPQSHIMKTQDGFQQCYNAQAAVEAAHGFIVAQEVSASPTDVRRLGPMLDQLVATRQVPAELSADAGYAWEENFLRCERAGIEAYIALRRYRHDEPPDADPAASRGTGRWPARARMREKLATEVGRLVYGLRKQTVEPVFGQIKACRGFRQFLLRGLAGVGGEWALVCTAHNLLRLHRPQPAGLVAD